MFLWLLTPYSIRSHVTPPNPEIPSARSHVTDKIGLTGHRLREPDATKGPPPPNLSSEFRPNQNRNPNPNTITLETWKPLPELDRRSSSAMAHGGYARRRVEERRPLGRRSKGLGLDKKGKKQRSASLKNQIRSTERLLRKVLAKRFPLDLNWEIP